MNYGYIAWANLTHRLSRNILNASLLAIGIATLIVIFSLKQTIDHKIEREATITDIAVGSKGSPLQILLSHIFHLDIANSNIDYDIVKKIKRLQGVESVSLISMGDNFERSKILGVSSNFLENADFSLLTGQSIKDEFDAIIGYNLQSKLKIGQSFETVHGLAEEGDHHDDHYKVVGILQKTDTIYDNMIFTSLESYWDVHNHGHHRHKLELTGILIKTKSPIFTYNLTDRINKKLNVQAVNIRLTLAQTMVKFAKLFNILQFFGLIFIIASLLSIILILLNRISEQKAEYALMIALGARYLNIFRQLFYENLILLSFSLISAALISFGFASYFNSLGLDVTRAMLMPATYLIIALLAINFLISVIFTLVIAKSEPSRILRHEY